MCFRQEKVACVAPEDDGNLERLERVMRKVPKFDREIFMAHQLDNLSYVEIAGITGRSIARVEKAILRTLVTVDRELLSRL